MNRSILIALMLLNITATASADYVETQWRVSKFNGEEWFLDASEIIGKEQSFFKGTAEGIFYNCPYAGQTYTYTTYEVDDFFQNPEFWRFKALRNEIAQDATKVFVHRITCASKNDPSKRQVLYPFITNDVRHNAWYLIEGGVFTLTKNQNQNP